MPHAALVTDDLPSLLSVGAAQPADDRHARCLLRQAQGTFQKWPEGFGGFRASIACQTVDGSVGGRVTVGPRAHVAVDCDDAVVRARLYDMLAGIALDRTPRFFDEGDGQFPISFVDTGNSSPCRIVHVHARPGALRYQIDPKGRVLGIERIAHGLRVVTAFGAFMRTTPGRVLPTEAATSIWEVATGTLVRSESVHDSHRRVEHVWLPSARRIAARSDALPIVLSLLDHELL